MTGPFGRDLGKLEDAGQADPRRQTPRAEFANSIGRYPYPKEISSANGLSIAAFIRQAVL
jgi:hypothetical protein